MRIVSASFFVVLTMAAVGGCSNEKAPPLTPASGKTATADDAYSALAKAQCDHEEACGRVGEDREYASREHCMNKMQANLRSKLADCNKDFDEDDVRQCMGAIESQSCSGFMDDLESFVACKTDDLCD